MQSIGVSNSFGGGGEYSFSDWTVKDSIGFRLIFKIACKRIASAASQVVVLASSLSDEEKAKGRFRLTDDRLLFTVGRPPLEGQASGPTDITQLKRVLDGSIEAR